MADQQPTPKNDINETVREGLKGMLRNLVLIVALVGIAYVGWILVTGASSPRAKLKTREQTLIAYTDFVAPFVGRTASRPSVTNLTEFLGYFDEESRQFFNEHYRELARPRFQFQEAKLATLTDAELKVEAMTALMNRPPLSGFGVIQEQRDVPGRGFELVLPTRGAGTATIRMVQQGELWYIAEWGGLLPQLRAEVERTATAR